MENLQKSASDRQIPETWFRAMTKKYRDRVSQTVGVEPVEEPDAISFRKELVLALLEQPTVTHLSVNFGIVKTRTIGGTNNGKEYNRLTVILIGSDADGKLMIGVGENSMIVDNGTQCCPPHEDFEFIEES